MSTEQHARLFQFVPRSLLSILGTTTLDHFLSANLLTYNTYKQCAPEKVGFCRTRVTCAVQLLRCSGLSLHEWTQTFSATDSMQNRHRQRSRAPVLYGWLHPGQARPGQACVRCDVIDSRMVQYQVGICSKRRKNPFSCFAAAPQHTVLTAHQ